MASWHFDREGVLQTHGEGTWQRILFNEFAATLTSEARPFPCVFGVNGFRTNQLRFAFPDPLDPEHLSPVLQEYLASARTYGPNTSLIVFARPGPVASIDAYRRRFWSLLKGLAAVDESAWPKDLPEELDHPHWEFCFAGEPIFVVCNTPAHVLRQSRRSTSFMLTFQPRWVFERILGSQKAAETAFRKVRDRLRPYDLIAPSPALGHYGAEDNREYQQYFIDDANEKPRCPFAKLGREPTGHSLIKQAHRSYEEEEQAA